MGLCDLRVARECMWVAVRKCVLSGWEKEGVERASRFADGVWELMADPRHTGHMTALTDPKRRADVVGMLVLLHASRVELFGEGERARAAVEKYTQMMLKLWDSAELDFQESDWNDANYKMLMWAPVWRGTIMAQKVLGGSSPMGKQLDTKLSKELEPLMQRCQAALLAHPPANGVRRGLKMYEDLVQVSA